MDHVRTAGGSNFTTASLFIFFGCSIEWVHPKGGKTMDLIFDPNPLDLSHLNGSNLLFFDSMDLEKMWILEGPKDGCIIEIHI